MEKKHYAYMLICADNTIYSGYTINIENRLKTHNEGKGAKYTKYRLPVRLAYLEEFKTKSEALHREIELKKLTRKKKECLIQKYKKSNIYEN